MSILTQTKQQTKADLGLIEKRQTKFVDTLFMQVHRYPKRFAYTFYAFNILNLCFILGVPVAYIWQIISFDRPKEHVWSEVFKWIFKTTFTLSGIKVEVEQTENIPKGRTVIFTPNHTSYIDGPVMSMAFFDQTIRSVVAPIPYFPFPFSYWLKKIDCIDVVRDKEEHKKYHQINRPKEAIAKAVKKLHEGEDILIFPEGHLEKEHYLLYFHTGPVRIALKARCDIVPVTVIGAYDTLPPKKFLLKSGKIRIIFHKPINLEKYYDMEDDHSLVKRLTWEMEKDIIENLPKSFVPDEIMDRLPEYIKEKRGWE